MTGRTLRRASGAAVISAGAVVASASPASAAIPNPVGIVTDALGGATGWAFEKVADGIAKWILGAVEFFVTGAIDFLRTSARPDVEGAWFSGPDSPYSSVRAIAAVLLVGFVLLGLIQGLLAGDPGGMVRRVAGGLPLAVLGMVVSTAVVGHLLELTDAMSNAVLSTTDNQAVRFLSGFGATVTGLTSGFATVILGLVAVFAALLLWIELIVRASLVYLLVAISPLGFAATLWPASRGFLRKTVELLVAIILSKFVICVALSIGVAALSGAGTAGEGSGSAADAGAGLGTLLIGAVILGLAAFAPFLIIKLVPVAEAALVAQGVSRGPLRATQTGMSTAYSASRLTRIAGGGGGTSAASGAPAAAGASAGATAMGATAPSAAPAAAAGPAGAAVASGAAIVKTAAKAGRSAARSAGAPTDDRTVQPAPQRAPKEDGR